MKKSKFNHYHFFLSLFVCFNSFSKQLEKEDLLVFSKKENIYVPILNQYSENNQISFIIKKDYINHFLTIESNSENHIFHNNKYNCLKTASQILTIQLKETKFKANDLITIYANQPLTEISIKINDSFKIHQKLSKTKENEKKTYYEIQQKRTSFNTIYIICFIIFLTVVAIAKQMGIETHFLFKKSSNISFNHYSTRLNSKPNFSKIEIILLSVTIFSILTLLYLAFNHNFYNETQTKETSDFFLFFIKFTVKLIIIKIFLHLIFGYFLKIQSFTVTIVTEIFRFLALFLLIIALFLFFTLTPFFTLIHLNYDFKWVLPFLLFIILFVREFYLLLFKFGFNKNYLFAYICICDLYPFVYILKLT